MGFLSIYLHSWMSINSLNLCLFFFLDLKFSANMSNLWRISFDAMPFVQWIQEIGASKSLHHWICSPKVYELRWGRSSEVLQLQRLIKREYDYLFCTELIKQLIRFNLDLSDFIDNLFIVSLLKDMTFENSKQVQECRWWWWCRGALASAKIQWKICNSSYSVIFEHTYNE